jgi:ATP-dependent helicase YprA (DUF1998 family)
MGQVTAEGASAMTNFRKMLDEIEAHRASLPPEVRAKLEADEREAQRQSLIRAGSVSV